MHDENEQREIERAVLRQWSEKAELSEADFDADTVRRFYENAIPEDNEGSAKQIRKGKNLQKNQNSKLAPLEARDFLVKNFPSRLWSA